MLAYITSIYINILANACLETQEKIAINTSSSKSKYLRQFAKSRMSSEHFCQPVSAKADICFLVAGRGIIAFCRAEKNHKNCNRRATQKTSLMGHTFIDPVFSQFYIFDARFLGDYFYSEEFFLEPNSYQL